MKTFCISLQKNRGKWDDILKRIKDAGFEEVEIFPGVNGNEIGQLYKGEDVSDETRKLVNYFGGVENLLTPWALYGLVKKQQRKHHSQLGSWGGVGCYLSHVLIWMKMVQEQIPFALIFEDDVMFSSKSIKKEFESRMNVAPQDADTIFLGVNDNFSPIKYNEYFDKVDGVFFGLHAYIMTLNGAKKFLKRALPIEIQIDSNMSYVASLNDIKLYTMNGLCSQNLHISSIQTICSVCNLTEYRYRIIMGLYFALVICLIIYVLIRLQTSQE